MAGLVFMMDVWRKNPNFCANTANKVLQNHKLFSQTFAVSAVAAATATIHSGHSIASRILLRDAGTTIAYSDAGAEITDDYFSKLRSYKVNVLPNYNYIPKEYPIELKPLFSAFEPRSFALTTLRSFLLCYLPLLEPPRDIDDDDFLEEEPRQPPDLIAPLKKSVKQIIRETSIVTTRRVLERVAVHYASQRMAWKLCKDVPRSAVRKASRKMPSSTYFCKVSRTTFRGHLLAMAASWIVQVGNEIYRFLFSLSKSEETDSVDNEERIKQLGKKVFGATIKCGASLIFASIGAATCSTVIYKWPSLGVVIGCAAGDVVGPIVVTIFCEKVFHLELRASD